MGVNALWCVAIVPGLPMHISLRLHAQQPLLPALLLHCCVSANPTCRTHASLPAAPSHAHLCRRQLLRAEGLVEHYVGAAPADHAAIIEAVDGAAIAVDLSTWLMQVWA